MEVSSLPSGRIHFKLAVAQSSQHSVVGLLPCSKAPWTAHLLAAVVKRSRVTSRSADAGFHPPHPSCGGGDDASPVLNR